MMEVLPFVPADLLQYLAVQLHLLNEYNYLRAIWLDCFLCSLVFLFLFLRINLPNID